jgi:hypothetical protein
MRRFVVLLTLVAAIGGCGSDAGPDPDAVPADLAIDYRWNTGVSNVGPDFAAYSVSLDMSGSGTIRFTVGHPSAEQDMWAETFDLFVGDLRVLYLSLHEVDLFSRTWMQEEPKPGSGWGSSLLVVAEGKTYVVPHNLADRDDADLMATVYESIRSLVPETIWEGFETRRDDYLSKHDY